MARTQLALALERIAALEAALASTAPDPATVAASAHFRSRDIPCSAPKPCSRTFRTAKRAAIHGVDKGGHEPR